jgi:hypothetical protein
MTARPSSIVGAHLVLDRRGAALVALALRIAGEAVGRDGMNYRGRAAYDDYSWVLAQADLVASGSAASGTPGRAWRVEVGDSAVWSTRQAARFLGLTPRGVVAAIGRGDRPAERVGRGWVLQESEVRQYAGRRRRRGAGTSEAGAA